MATLKQWLSKASADEREALAVQGGTSVAQLYHLSNGIRTASAAKAGEIARASGVLHADNPNLPLLTRGDLCPACRDCEHYAACTPADLL